MKGELTTKAKKDKPANLRAFDVYVDGDYFKVEVAVPFAQGGNPPVVTKKEKVKIAASTDDTGNLLAPIPGMIIEYKVKVGDKVKAGDTVVVLEAMKMFNNLSAPRDGIVKVIDYSAGDQVAKGDILCYIEA